MAGRIVCCGIISSCQSAATSKIVKALLVLSPSHVRSAIASTRLYLFSHANSEFTLPSQCLKKVATKEKRCTRLNLQESYDVAIQLRTRSKTDQERCFHRQKPQQRSTQANWNSLSLQTCTTTDCNTEMELSILGFEITKFIILGSCFYN